MGKTQISDKAVGKFRTDIQSLYDNGYSHKEIAAKMGIETTNLSNYLSTKERKKNGDLKKPKRPGKILADKLYAAFGNELKKIEKEKKAGEPKVLQVNEPKPVYSKERDKITKAQDEKIHNLEKRISVVEENTKKILELLEAKREN